MIHLHLRRAYYSLFWYIHRESCEKSFDDDKIHSHTLIHCVGFEDLPVIGIVNFPATGVGKLPPAFFQFKLPNRVRQCSSYSGITLYC